MDIYSEERLKKIIEIVNKKERMSVHELAEIFKVSEVTIRRDLRELTDKKELTRTHGGAIKKATPMHIIWGAGSRNIFLQNKESKFEEQIKTDTEILKKIADFAVNFIKDEDNIIIEATNINVYLAQAVDSKLHLNIFTNSPVISSVLAKPGSNSNIYCSGGLLKKETSSFIGPRVTDFYCSLNVDKAFISIGAVSPDKRITMNSIEQADVRKVIMKSAKEIIAMGTSSRFNKVLLFEVAQLSSVNILVTDSGLDLKLLKELEESGIEVFMV